MPCKPKNFAAAALWMTRGPAVPHGHPSPAAAAASCRRCRLSQSVLGVGGWAAGGLEARGVTRVRTVALPGWPAALLERSARVLGCLRLACARSRPFSRSRLPGQRAPPTLVLSRPRRPSRRAHRPGPSAPLGPAGSRVCLPRPLAPQLGACAGRVAVAGVSAAAGAAAAAAAAASVSQSVPSNGGRR